MKTTLLLLIVLFNSLVLNSQELFHNEDGCAVPIQEEHDYEYYKDEYKKASTTIKVGMGITFAGLGMSTIGFVVGVLAYSWGAIIYGTGFFIAGAAITAIGIPVWIAGGIKRGNNKRAMQKAKASLSFGPTNDGVGLTLRF